MKKIIENLKNMNINIKYFLLYSDYRNSLTTGIFLDKMLSLIFLLILIREYLMHIHCYKLRFTKDFRIDSRNELLKVVFISLHFEKTFFKYVFRLNMKIL